MPENYTADLVLVGVVASAVFAYFYRKRVAEAKAKKEREVLARTVVPTSVSKARANSRNFIRKMEEQKKDLVIFFGSQTGTAEDYASRIARDAKQFGFEPLIADFEDYDFSFIKDLSKDKLVMLVVATYGEGEPTDNAQEAYKLFAEEEHEANELASVNYLVFGLGNKTYEQYNAIGKFWDAKFEALGAHRLFEMGLGDDDANLEDDYVAWKDRMWPVVCKHFGKDMHAANQVITRQFKLTEHGEGEIPADKVFKGELHTVIVPPAKQAKAPYDVKNPYYVDIKTNSPLMPQGHSRACMHLTVSIEGTPLSYMTGDHIGFFPSNNPREVEKLAAALGVTDLDRVISFVALDESAAKRSPFPVPTTYRTALTHYLDIMAPPRTHIIKALSEHAGSEADKAFFEHLASAEAKDELAKYVLTDCRTLAEILAEHPTTHPPADLMLELLPRLQCRYYSIASSPKVQPHSISVCATVVEYTTNTGRHATGIATGWLRTFSHPDTHPYPSVPVFIRKSNFKLPGNPSRPVIMVGPGTGVAPFRGFIQERHWQRQHGKQVGPTILFFGCRSHQEFLYEEELRNYEREGTLELHVAFSRSEGMTKQYVQHLMQKQKQRLWQLFSEGAYFYVCGDAKNMARDVNKTLTDIATEFAPDEKTANGFVKSLRSSNRYLEDVWS